MPKRTKAELRKLDQNRLLAELQRIDREIQALRQQALETHAVLDEKLAEERQRVLETGGAGHVVGAGA